MNESPQDPRPDHLDELFATAREQRPDTSRAEFGFETRLLARLRERHRPDAASLWSVVAWRMAPFFAVCVVGVALWLGEFSSDSNDAAIAAGLSNPAAADLWGN